MVYDLKNKVVLATGAASGIGAEVVKLLAQEGAKHVAVLDVAEAAGIALQNELNSKYGANKVKFYKCDVTDEDQLFAGFSGAIADNGYIDVVINNAGIMNDSLKLYKKEIRINVIAVVTGTLKALELMRKDQGGKGGTVINISSVAALCQKPYLPIYWGTKSAVLQFSNCIGLDDYYSRTGVRVLAVCFGRTETPLLANLGNFDKEIDDGLLEALGPYPTQSAESAARGVIAAYKEGESGSTWVAANSRPAVDITPTIKQVYDVLEQFCY